MLSGFSDGEIEAARERLLSLPFNRIPAAGVLVEVLEDARRSAWREVYVGVSGPGE